MFLVKKQKQKKQSQTGPKRTDSLSWLSSMSEFLTLKNKKVLFKNRLKIIPNKALIKKCVYLKLFLVLSKTLLNGLNSWIKIFNECLSFWWSLMLPTFPILFISLV